MKQNDVRRRIRSSLLSVVVAFSAFGFAPRALARDKSQRAKFSNVCQYILTPENLKLRAEETYRVAAEFNRRNYEYLGNSRGFSFNRPVDRSETNAPKTRTIYVRSEPRDYTQALLQETWKAHGQKYTFMNVGLKNLEAYSTRVNRFVFGHLLTRPDENLVIRYDQARWWIGRRLLRYRWAVHDGVMDVYMHKKPYLTAEDFRTLVYYNRISHNSDVFALFSPKKKGSKSGSSKAELTKRVLLTIQISYFGNRHYFRPSVADLVDSDYAYNTDMMPFEYRIPENQRSEFRAQFFAKFPRQYTCEMLRYASMDPLIPQDMRDRFLLNAFQKVVQRGMKYIVAGADRFTARLYRRYGFKVYAELPTGQSLETEYLLYLRVNSPEFDELMKRLAESAKTVRHKTSDLE